MTHKKSVRPKFRLQNLLILWHLDYENGDSFITKAYRVMATIKHE